MTPTLNEIAFNLIHVIRPRVANSEVISIDNIKFDIKNVRAQLLRNELNKNRTIDSEIVQDLGCVELELIDAAECCDVTADCKILRSKLPLPSPIELHHAQGITRVGPVNKTSRKYTQIPYERVPYIFYNKFTKNEIYFFLMNNSNYLYVLTHDFKHKVITDLNVQGVWEDPETVRQFKTCEGFPCYNDDLSFPVKAWMVPMIKQLVIEKYLGKEALAALDNTGDFQDNPNVQKHQ